MKQHLHTTSIVLACSFCLAGSAYSQEVFVVGDPDIGTAHRLYGFHADGSPVGDWAGPGANIYHSVAQSPDGRIFVADGAGNVIEEFDAFGAYVGVFASTGTDLLGGGPDRLEIDSKGNLYACTLGYRSEPRNAVRYDLATGALMQTYEDLVWPRGIDADSDGNVYVLEAGQNIQWVRAYTRSGAPLQSFNIPEVDNPRDLAIDEQGQIAYVADEWGGASAVVAYSLAPATWGDYVKTVTVPGLTSDYTATGLHYDPASDHLYISFMFGFAGGGSAYEIDTDGNVLNMFWPAGVIAWDVVPEPATLSLLSLGGLALLRKRRS